MSTSEPVKQPPLFVIGRPVKQSMSPKLFDHLFASAHVDSALTTKDIGPDEIEAVCDAARAGDIAGFCVTAPYKEILVDLVDTLDDTAAFCRAVNWVTPIDGQLHGSNTDVAGVQGALRDAGISSAKNVLILGAGGAARAAVGAAIGLGATTITVANRTPSRATALIASVVDGVAALAALAAQRAPTSAPRPNLLATALDATDARFSAAADAADVIVNATTCGMNDKSADPLPPSFVVRPQTTVLDMVYRPLQTALLVRALERGALVVDGLAMLVHQAIAGFECIQRGQPSPRSLPEGIATDVHRVLAKAILDEEADGDRGKNPFILAGRARINAIDEEMIALLANRFATASAIGGVKAILNEPVVRPDREIALRKMHREWAAAHRAPLSVVEAVFDAVLDASRKSQASLQASPSLKTHKPK